MRPAGLPNQRTARKQWRGQPGLQPSGANGLEQAPGLAFRVDSLHDPAKHRDPGCTATDRFDRAHVIHAADGDHRFIEYAAPIREIAGALGLPRHVFRAGRMHRAAGDVAWLAAPCATHLPQRVRADAQAQAYALQRVHVSPQKVLLTQVHAVGAVRNRESPVIVDEQPGARCARSLNASSDFRGVYRLVRHPMYTSFFISGLGQALLLANWIAGPAALLAVALLVIVRVPHEEQMMVAQFGNDYRDYVRRTGGILPRFS